MLSVLVACGGGTAGNSSVNNSSTTSHGVVQKGPLEIGSLVTITQLDSLGKETSHKLQTKIVDKQGHFTFDIPSSWKFVEGQSFISISAEGFYFDEFSGKKSINKTVLNSISSSLNTKSVNLLSHWIAKRTRSLLKQDSSLTVALKQSKTELNKIFGINNQQNLNLSQSEVNPADNALLLLLSGALMEVAQQSDINPQQVIDEIASDFSDDGVLNERGDDWFNRMQIEIRSNPKAHINHYAKLLNLRTGKEAPIGENLPKAIVLASRPSAILPTELTVTPGERVVLDGSASHDNPIENEGILINYTWFRVDQQAYKTPFSDRFSQTPSITVPNEETELLLALVVTDEQKITDTAVMKVLVRKPIPTNHPPIAVDDTKSTDEDTPITLGLADIVTSNDTDADGNALSITMVSSAVNGTVQLFSNGSITFTPDLDFSGNASFDYTISDGNGGIDTATVSISIIAQNDVPVGTADSASTNEDTAVNIAVVANDSDVDGDALTPTNISTPTNGTAVLNSDGVTIDYTPNTNFNGTDTFTYTPNDGTTNGSLVTVTVAVGAQNDAPVGTADSATTNEDTAVNIAVVDNDADIDGDALTPTNISTPTNGTAVLNSDGVSIDYSPNTNFNGTDTFTYTPSDGITAGAVVTVTVTVNAQNDAPIANNQTINVTEDTAKTFILNYSDMDNDLASLVYLVTTPPLHGSLSGTAPNITYTPDLNYDDTDSFEYKITDADGASDTAVVTINLTAVNDPPEARSFTLQLNQGSSIDFVEGSDNSQLGGIDTENDSLKITDMSLPLNSPSTGSLSTTDLGSGTIYTYTPNPNFCGTDTIQYKVQEINSGQLTSSFATVTFDVNCRPLANAGSDRSVTKNSNVSLSGLGSNDSDGTVEGYAWVQKAGTLPVVALTNANSASPSFIAPDIAVGAASIDLFFELIVIDNDNFASLVDEVKVTVTETCITAPPIAITGVNRDVVQGSTVNLNGSGEADTSCNFENMITNYYWTQMITGSEPSVTIVEDSNSYPAKFSFVAPPVTSITTFTFKLIVDDYPTSNDLSGPVTMTVTVHPDSTTLPPNLPPTGSDYSVEVLGNGYGSGISLLATDPDGDDVDMTYQIVSGIDASKGDLDTSYISSGYVYYTPNYPVADLNSFSFRAIDQNGLASSSVIAVTITKIVEPSTNNPPVSLGKTITVSPLNYSNRRHDVYLQTAPNPLAYDVDTNDFIIFKKLNETSNGLTFNLYNNSSSLGYYLRASNTNYSTPADGSYEYMVIDKYGRESIPATISISFEP